MTGQRLRKLERPARVLLVEDNYGDVLLTREACEKSQMAIQLSIAEDGEEALAMLRSEGAHADCPRPDLVLLDVNLPCMDGREVLQAMNGDPDLWRIPVIVLTCSKAESEIFESYDLGANSYIVKPVNFERLQEVVDSLEAVWLNVAALPTALTE